MSQVSGRLPVVLGAVAAIGVLGATGLAARSVHGATQDLVLSSSAPAYAAAPAAAGAVQAAPRGDGVVTVDPGWASRMAGRAGIPAPAMRAYATAALRLSAEQPSCGVGWTTLAGLGYVESLHGTIDGRSLLEDGHSSTPILGPALDGAGPVAAVPASPTSAQWHGDAEWDHAVGPLQFLPATWETWASDGDGDGSADPTDLDDAAYAAARYLCASGRPLDTGDAWSAAVFSYNHSDDYVRSVYSAASAYAARTSPTK